MRSGGVRRLRQPEARHFALGHQPDDIAPDELDVVVAEHDPAGEALQPPRSTGSGWQDAGRAHDRA